MAVDLETLLAPVAGDDPMGPDLSYDPDRDEIVEAFSRPVAGGVADFADVDWRAIIKLIEAQSQRTKDAALASYLCQAGAATRDLALTRKGAEFLAGLYDRYWDEVHPRMEEEFGFQARKAPCAALTNYAGFLAPLKNAVVLTHPRQGEFSVADLERFKDAGETADGYLPFSAALDDLGDDQLIQADANLAGITEALRRVDAVLVARAVGDTGANLQPTYDTLRQMRQSVSQFIRTPVASEAASGEDGHGGGNAKSPEAGWGGGRIDNREGVLRALDAIADYYRRHEPGSPVPLALQRAREWVTLDFLSVLKDIAPASVEEARKVLLFKQEG